MSLNELVDMYNRKLNSSGSRSTMATDPSHHTPQSTFTMNTGFESVADTANSMSYNNNNYAFTDNAASALLFEADSYRFQLNDRVLAGDTVRPPPHNQPRVERIKFADRVVFSTDTEVEDDEHNEEYTTRYPDVKPQLNIINAQQAHIPPIDMYTNPGDQVQRLIQQGKLKNLHGYIKYPYNYIEPPWHFSPLDEQQGHVNLNPPRSHLTAQDIESNTIDDFDTIQLPYGVPQDIVSQDRYESIPLPKMVYENFVPLIATRRIVCRRQTSEHVSGEASFQQYPNHSGMVSKLSEVEEMTFKV
ncbi:unnamed protein product [Rotaria socialis]|uniref:Uncharacterized protein n=1 Tax=Rotaria socialis TaxID=392032 RepID=A0A817SVD8_9BILA|nr:unnamed protein product [Rotaria socialis]CAF3298278.1 unnamed protein product [Rotaria socialis]CAF3318134.1 unnamed protein product [Rotaria socialis]CAF3318665.1 unnamed protein product [Rotaria socialis]CAF3357104.1 unnamed protein product [Rotaria socialis]